MVEGVAHKGEGVKKDIKGMPPGEKRPAPPSREFRVRESQDNEKLILLQQVFQHGHNEVQNLQGKLNTCTIHKHLLSTHLNFLTIDWASRRHSLLQVLRYLSLILIINQDI